MESILKVKAKILRFLILRNFTKATLWMRLMWKLRTSFSQFKLSYCKIGGTLNGHQPLILKLTSQDIANIWGKSIFLTIKNAMDCTICHICTALFLLSIKGLRCYRNWNLTIIWVLTYLDACILVWETKGVL